MDFLRKSQEPFATVLARESIAKNHEKGRRWRFANCEFDERRYELRVNGDPVDVELKPLEVLHQLLINAGEIVTKEELFASVWPEVIVVDGSLATAVSKLRRALGNDGIVITVPRLGYRIGCPVETGTEAGPPITPLSLNAGDTIAGRGHWRLMRRLDPCSSSQVWLAEHPKTGELRVFKFATDGAQLKSLKREVTLARLLRESFGERPEFVRILEWNFDSLPFFTESEYAGPNLAEWAQIQGGISSVPVAVRLQLLIDIARAVDRAHSVGILHKDLKPANILISEIDGGWCPKIADFGSGTLLDLSRLGLLGITNAGFTRTHNENDALTGTMLYMAPELLAGQSPSPASDVYALGVLLYQLLTGEFRKPLSPGWEAEIEDPVLRSDIAEAACGDPARRLSSAGEFAQRLTMLDARRAEREAADRRLLAEAKSRSRSNLRPLLQWLLASAIIVVAVLSFFRIRSFRQTAHANTVAVLPFQNAAADTSLDFLRFALPDEIATTLSHMHALTIRPFTSTSEYAGAAVDWNKLRREVEVSSAVTGHYLHIGNTLQITMEAVDVQHNRLLWRDTVNVPADNLLALQAQVSAIARGKLASALGATEYVDASYPPPRNEQAYALYLRSLGVNNMDSRENEDAAAMLERSVALDGSYAPAWIALAVRLYGVARFRGGGPQVLSRSDEALEHALAIDPDSVNAANELILHRAERGQLAAAYAEAQNLLNRRPDIAAPHDVMGYVLRYGGLLEKSAEQCAAAEQLDVPWPSCATTYMELGQYAKARSLLRKDLGSEWSRALGIEILLRQGKTAEATRLDPPQFPGWENSDRMLLACARHEDPTKIASMVTEISPQDDPEVSYFFAGHLAYCGQAEAAIRMLKSALAGHYCSYPAVDLDPFFSHIRSAPGFAEVRRSAIECQSAFLKATNLPN